MLKTFSLGGIHPPENKFSAGKKIEEKWKICHTRKRREFKSKRNRRRKSRRKGGVEEEEEEEEREEK